MSPLDLIKLTPLMGLTSGRAAIRVGLIDGPVALNHPDLAGENIHEIPGKLRGICAQASSIACTHGTFVAGILSARRESSASAPAICPNCTLLVRPIFTETASATLQIPSTTPQDLAEALFESVDAGAHVINVSAALVRPSSRGGLELEEALNYAARHNVIVVAAAGNQGMLGSTIITRHPWVIPVVAYDLEGRPMGYSNLGNSIGTKGLGAPGDGVASLVSNDYGSPLALGGTSVAAPFVTGAIALLLSEFPDATSPEVKCALTQTYSPRRKSIVPPLLDAWSAYRTIASNHGRR